MEDTHTLSGPFKWQRRGKGYEVSTKGDKRFSAFRAVMPDGRTLEMHYQVDVKKYQPGGTDWRLGKGKPPLDPTVDLWKEYLQLWTIWAARHPELMEELYQTVALYDHTLTDCFAATPVNQAHALSVLLNELHEKKNEDKLLKASWV